MIYGTRRAGCLDWRRGEASDREAWRSCRRRKLSFCLRNVKKMNLFATIAAMAFGIFAVASPARAASIWGWRQLDKLAPEQRSLYLRLYRAFGIILCLAGLLVALDHIAFATYHQRGEH
jgi:hypothetical protein